MAAIPLDPIYITQKGSFLAPNKKGFNSLFFHELTAGYPTSVLKPWGLEITKLCDDNDIDYYWFMSHHGIKINVYPNQVIEEWWHSRN
jgi:hypothetical protein